MLNSLIIEIPADVVQAARIPLLEVEHEFRLELAVSLYQKGILPMSKARLIAQMSRFDFEEILVKRQIPHSYSEVDFEDDLNYVLDHQ